MAAAADTKSKPKPTQPMGLAFELEPILFGSRQHLFEAVKKALSEKDIAVTRDLFSRYCLHPLLPRALPGLLAAHDKRLSPDKLTAEADRLYRKALLAESSKPDAAMAALVRQALDAGARLGAVTFLAEDEARKLAARAGLPESLTIHVCRETGHETPRADCWLRLAKEMGCHARQVVALVSAGSACRSAVIAGMRVIVVPDTYTEHEDFTGADLVLEESRSLPWTDAAALLRPCAFR
jgi:beta-phosphoglucomutase-like phosphatase (HAD superfamily)